MKREEIFRSSCNGVDLNRVKDIIHSGHDICDKDFGQDGVIIASNIVKSFIRELPDGFIPYSFYNQFLGAGCINDDDLRVKTLKRILEELPDSNRNCLWYLCSFLVDVCKYEQFNQINQTS